MEMHANRDLPRQLEGYRLATAEILYYMPDHPGVLQTFVWQHYDLAPSYPRLNRFLDYWRREIDAVLNSVTVGRRQIIAAPSVSAAQSLFALKGLPDS
ncbi:MAG: Usg family protein [Rhodospirillales bacterium]|nr:Usg family protein [Rhodospirillales bacterium]